MDIEWLSCLLWRGPALLIVGFAAWQGWIWLHKVREVSSAGAGVRRPLHLGMLLARAREAPRQVGQAVGVLLGAVALSWLVPVLGGCPPLPTTASLGAEAAPATRTGTPFPVGTVVALLPPGSEGRIVDRTSVPGPTIAALDLRTLEEFDRAVLANDRSAIDRLSASTRIFLVEVGAAVSVLSEPYRSQSGLTYLRVRIRSGAATGKEGWVPVVALDKR
jgi:hypothetical protein